MEGQSLDASFVATGCDERTGRLIELDWRRRGQLATSVCMPMCSLNLLMFCVLPRLWPFWSQCDILRARSQWRSASDACGVGIMSDVPRRRSLYTSNSVNLHGFLMTAVARLPMLSIVLIRQH